jgi:hypothetical protein
MACRSKRSAKGSARGAQSQHRHRHPARHDRGNPRSLAEDRSEFDPRKFLKAATAAAREICKARFETFGTAGQASKIGPIPLEKMAERYAKGQLDGKVTGTRKVA